MGIGFSSPCQERKQDGSDDGPGPELISLNSKLQLALLSVSMDNIMSFNIDVGVVYHCHLSVGLSLSWEREGGRVFIEELHDSHVGCGCNDCNGSTICIHYEQKTYA